MQRTMTTREAETLCRVVNEYRPVLSTIIGAQVMGGETQVIGLSADQWAEADGCLDQAIADQAMARSRAATVEVECPWCDGGADPEVWNCGACGDTGRQTITAEENARRHAAWVDANAHHPECGCPKCDPGPEFEPDCTLCGDSGYVDDPGPSYGCSEFAPTATYCGCREGDWRREDDENRARVEAEVAAGEARWQASILGAEGAVVGPWAECPF